MDQGDGGRDRLAVVPGHEHAAGRPRHGRHRLELLQRFLPQGGPTRDHRRQARSRHPAIDPVPVDLVEDRYQPARGVELDLDAGPLGLAHLLPDGAGELIVPKRLEAGRQVDHVHPPRLLDDSGHPAG